MTEAGPRPSDAGTLGILAAAGPLPIEIALAAERSGRKVHVVAIEGFASPDLARFPGERVALGQIGRMLASLRKAGVREMVIAGAMQRPSLWSLRVDWGFVQSLPTVLALTKGGDDSVLRRVVRFFEGHGLAVIGAGDVAPALLAPAGLLAGPTPTVGNRAAIARAAGLVTALGPFDIGQGVVATADSIIAVEGVRGTDAMLRDLSAGGGGAGLARGAVLVKLAKPGQEMRIDLPTIGPETVRRAEAAGLSGVAVGARSAIVLERERLVAEASRAALFVEGLVVVGPFAENPCVQGVAPTAPASPAITDAGEPATATTQTALAVMARRAPTPADRADIALGRRLMTLLRRTGAGRAAIVTRAHVTAVSGALPLAPFVAAQGRPSSWGRRAVKGRIGTLLIDGAGERGAASSLDAGLFGATIAAGLAGVAYLGPLPPDGERRREIAAWANEAGVFLVAEPGGPSP